MADLSGYTALTEIHGDTAAMKLAGRYLTIGKKSLVGKSMIYEITGDQLLIISSSADDLAMTAFALKRNAEKESHFLEVHFGLHYGSVIEKNGRLFGAVVNFTSRIVSSAGANKILCSEELIKALTRPEDFRFIYLGNLNFKNVLRAAKIFEMFPVSAQLFPEFHVDPICHMRLSLKESIISAVDNGIEYFFCSETCKKLFEEYAEEVMA